MENDTPASKNHFWVEIRYVPVIVTESNDEGDLVIEVTEQSLKTADEEAAHGCWFCHTPLNTETYKTECCPIEVNSSQSS